MCKTETETDVREKKSPKDSAEIKQYKNHTVAVVKMLIAKKWIFLGPISNGASEVPESPPSSDESQALRLTSNCYAQ